MARQEKRTRLRGLPAREQLRAFDNASGSLPTVLRFSYDRKAGDSPSVFDDMSTLAFGGRASNYFPGLGIVSGSRYLRTSGASDFPLTSSILVSVGGNNAGLLDDSSFVAQKEPQRMAPFIEHRLHGADNKGQLTQSAFWLTGSAVANVGEGFASPLWSKQKIEIDISVAMSTSVNLKRATTHGTEISGSSFPMAYYNFSTKVWEPIGLGYEINAQANPDDMVENAMLGFMNGFNPAGNTFFDLNSFGFCASDLGFPFHPKFHATSSQTLSMRNYISEPFVLEKAVIEVSGAWAVGSNVSGIYNASSRRTVTASINTCFLLNQRRNQNFQYQKNINDLGDPFYYVRLTASVPKTQRLSPNGQAVRIDTVRDIMGFSQILSFASGAYTKLVVNASTGVSSSPGEQITQEENEVIFTGTDPGSTGANWSGLVRLSMSMCVPGSSEERMITSITGSGAITKVLLRFSASNDYDELSLGFNGFRTGLGFFAPSTRGLVGDYFGTPTIKELSLDGVARSEVFKVPSAKRKVNPYILHPEDTLVLGWQLPVSANPAQGITAGSNESTFTFAPGSYKMTLYGTYVREGKELNEAVNQMLSSRAIHEIIG